MFFYDEEAPQGKPTYFAEDKGAAKERFIFDNDRFDSGKFIGADGQELSIKTAG